MGELIARAVHSQGEELHRNVRLLEAEVNCCVTAIQAEKAARHCNCYADVEHGYTPCAAAQETVAHGAPDVLIGADVVVWPVCVRPLVATLKHYLQLGARAAYLGYVVRQWNVDESFREECKAEGLSMAEDTDLAALMPEDPGKHPLRILVLTLGGGELGRAPPRWTDTAAADDAGDEVPEWRDWSALPC